MTCLLLVQRAMSSGLHGSIVAAHLTLLRETSRGVVRQATPRGVHSASMVVLAGDSAPEEFTVNSGTPGGGVYQPRESPYNSFWPSAVYILPSIPVLFPSPQ